MSNPQAITQAVARDEVTKQETLSSAVLDANDKTCRPGSVDSGSGRRFDQELSWLWWATGGVVLLVFGAWGLVTGATWAAQRASALVRDYGAMLLLLGGCAVMALVCAACVWRETVVTELEG